MSSGQTLYKDKYQQNLRMQRPQIGINMPDISTSKYKNSAKQIEQLVRELNGFTDNLQSKVNTMLKGQETQFVNSYKQHMHTIQNTLKQYQMRIQDYQKKIQHYENEGMLSILLKKIQFLEDNQKKLLKNQQKKDRIIIVLKGQITTQQGQIRSLQAKIKEYMSKAPLPNPEKSQSTFPTQINLLENPTLRSNNSIQQLNKQKSGCQYQTLTTDRSPLDLSHGKVEMRRYNKQLQFLKKRNQALSSLNSKIIDKANNIEQFFIEVVNDLKKKITNRKKISECSYEDFKQEDKLELLVKVLSNEDILKHLYNKIFNKNEKQDAQDSFSFPANCSAQKELRIGRSQRVVSRLPAISSFRR